MIEEAMANIKEELDSEQSKFEDRSNKFLNELNDLKALIEQAISNEIKICEVNDSMKDTIQSQRSSCSKAITERS